MLTLNTRLMRSVVALGYRGLRSLASEMVQYISSERVNSRFPASRIQASTLCMRLSQTKKTILVKMRPHTYSFDYTLDIHRVRRALPSAKHTSLGFDNDSRKHIYKALGLQGLHPTFKMRLATGPLHTGRYIPELVQNPGQYPIVNSDASKLTFTNDPRSDAAKVRV